MAELTQTEVGRNVVVYTLGGDTIDKSYGTNAIAVLGSAAVLLVDPLIAPAHGRLIADALVKRIPAPVRFVVLTHHHTDHSLGASWFEARGATVIGHTLCRERMAAEHPDLISARRQRPETRDLYADAVPVLPSVTFEEGLMIHLGETPVEVWHPGWVHTPGDAFLFLPEERVAICGDLAVNKYHYNYEHASVVGLRKGLDALRSLDADTFIPGHGPVGGADMLDAQQRYHETVERIVRTSMANGSTDTAIEIEAAFPDYRLRSVVPTAIDVFSAHLARVEPNLARG
jgi:cyclase